MAVTAARPGPPDPDYTKQERGFIFMAMTVDDFSYTPSEEERSRDAAQVVASGRTSWKTLQGKGEAVWPPFVEAALFEALEQYRPGDAGYTMHKTSRRFPNRNKFISNHIFQSTGRKRTPKQVGSRLQQLQKTCNVKKVLRFISQGNTSELTPVPSQVECSSGSLSSPIDSQARKSFSGKRCVYIEIAVQNQLWPLPTPSINLVDVDSRPQSIQLAPFATPQLCLVFLVYEKESNAPVHTEAGPLKCISFPCQSTGWLYSSDLVPSFWRKLCLSQDASRYTIVQRLEPVDLGCIPGFNNLTTHNISLIYNFSSTARTLRNPSNTPSWTHSHTSISNPCKLAPDSDTVYPTWQHPQRQSLDMDINYSPRSVFPSYLDSTSIPLPSVRPLPFSSPSPESATL